MKIAHTDAFIATVFLFLLQLLSHVVNHDQSSTGAYVETRFEIIE